jgi:hypothetical protein
VWGDPAVASQYFDDLLGWICCTWSSVLLHSAYSYTAEEHQEWIFVAAGVCMMCRPLATPPFGELRYISLATWRPTFCSIEIDRVKAIRLLL